MNRTPNPELDRIVLNHLVEKYKLNQHRDSIHLSTLVYCLTKGFFDLRTEAEPTDEEVMLFSLGLGLQEVITPKGTEIPVYEKAGITFSPDYYFPVENKYVEIKTTRMSMKKCLEGGYPETWIEYIKGGCFIRGVRKYELSVLYITGSYNPPFPQIHSETLGFDEAELLSNWDRLLLRKAVLDNALDSNSPPTPYAYCKDWECKNCRYSMTCNVLSGESK